MKEIIIEIENNHRLAHERDLVHEYFIDIIVIFVQTLLDPVARSPTQLFHNVGPLGTELLEQRHQFRIFFITPFDLPTVVCTGLVGTLFIMSTISTVRKECVEPH